MKALVYQRELMIQEVPEPELKQENTVKVKIYLAGICGTDREAIKGGMLTNTSILGHEAVGVIVSKGAEVTHLQIGDLVVINPNEHCGNCLACRSGQFHLCDGNGEGIEIAGVTKDGVFAEYFVTEARFVEQIDSNLSKRKQEMMLLTEPLACVLAGLDKLDLEQAKKILVIGLGAIGYLAAKVLTYRGHQVSVMDRDQKKIEELIQSMSDCFTPESLPVGETFDCVIDAVGNQLSFALNHLRTEGQILLLGIRNDGNCELSPKELTQNNTRLIASSEYTTHLVEAKRYLSEYLVLPEKIFSKYSFFNFKEAFDHPQDQHSSIKAVLEFSAGKEYFN